ncbi:G-type lectin S-receptor-like serine/threonine-protein kinase LECRK3 [Magnolia sinica]|uniref:G-type lectin S-receptor-like serine/threonine-protein kinase LECRK3 n=1 Tax=Magnolia sinica TaxID=86752 RepID=UPI002658BC1A|nr:G-type lectin S-receptor-like serine/threonine-protein kinase LECRK3 [Magnolia sinica]
MRSWYSVHSIPENICMRLTGSVGSGACGFNSYCMLDDLQRPSCKCPPHYSFLDPENEYKGCKQDFPPQNCESSGLSNAQEQFVMVEMDNTDWPLSDFKHDQSTDENRCKEDCLSDCFCAVAIFRDGNCWKKKLPLSNGRMNSSVGGKAFIKVPGDNTSFPDPVEECGEKKDRTSLIIAGALILGSSAFLNVLLVGAISLALLYSRHRKKQMKFRPSSSLLGSNLRSFTYKELEEATDGFKEEIGRGSFGTVYKGTIAELDSRNFVAVKKLDKVVQEGEREFRTEVSTIGETHHKNLVRLLGFCDEETHRLLVYEFMSNGSLATFLFGSLRLDWNQRIRIVFGIAKGLMYLHEGCSTQIIHCDIKPQNILLDDYFTARISDFGLAKLSKITEQTRSIKSIRGTRGYVAPEWFKNVTITAKVDVYSFGVMLLEIICCRKNIELEIGSEEKAVLTDWAYSCYRDGRLGVVVENDEEALADYKRLERLVMVAIWCIQEDPSRRLSMKKVVQMIEGLIEVPVPTPPFSICYT